MTSCAYWEAEDDNLFSSMQPSVILSDGEKSILKKGLDGFPKATINGTEMYYAMEDMREKCPCGMVFDYSLESNKSQSKYFISRDEFVPVAGLRPMFFLCFFCFFVLLKIMFCHCLL